MNQWRLDTLDQTLVLSSLNDRLPGVIYWGSRLPDNENLSSLSTAGLKIGGTTYWIKFQSYLSYQSSLQIFQDNLAAK